MQYTNIRGLRISRFMLGTVQLGMEYGIANRNGKPDLERSFEILTTALDEGVSCFDTASIYGNSEEILGKYFSSMFSGKEQPLITTKFKIDPAGDISRAGIEKQMYGLVEKSLQRLKIRTIPIYMLHNAKDMSLYGNAVRETLKKMKTEGLIERAGVSVYNPEEVEEMLKDGLYEAVQLPMNIFDQRILKSGVLLSLMKAEIIVFVRSVFLKGLFFLKAEELPERLHMAAGPLRTLQKLSDREGLSIAQLAMSFIRDMEGVTSLVVGAETAEQVNEDIKLMEASIIISERTRQEINRTFADVPILEIIKRLSF